MTWFLVVNLSVNGAALSFRYLHGRETRFGIDGGADQQMKRGHQPCRKHMRPSRVGSDETQGSGGQHRWASSAGPVSLTTYSNGQIRGLKTENWGRRAIEKNGEIEVASAVAVTTNDQDAS
ncbi:hypothetical protein QBC42DRAFT_256226 [Cladorrhinum samala]|uniref:Secreted protein n=1 Tax=Cladorrhinum samala TaxID=585594 RepID=A0AAV9HCQ1_9PEZI|nr:hypothetical protein QBC42DRAFT_256226 [Cladorrhinum samala]